MTLIRLALLFVFLLGLGGCAGARPGAPAESAACGPTGDGGPVAASEPIDGGSVVAAAQGAPADEESSGSEDNGEIDDGAETPGAAVEGQAYHHPLDTWSQRQIEEALATNIESLGSMSLGYTNAGALVNGISMPEDDAWELVDPDHAWGTRETVDYLAHCLRKIAEQFPGASTMYIGHISGRRGGHLAPHISHQAGRDVDVSYYYLAGQGRWYATARAANLDRERTWAFIKTLVIDTDVELILMDRSVQRLVREYAVGQGEDRSWVDQLFDGSASMPPLVRHAKGHATHIHVRFYNPLAQETGRRAYDILVKRHLIEPPSYYVRHKVKEGETLLGLALKYRVPAKAIQQANGMKSDLIRSLRDYRIPQRGGVKAGPRPTIPARRAPHERRAG